MASNSRFKSCQQGTDHKPIQPSFINWQSPSKAGCEKAQARSNPDPSRFDWTRYQDFCFVNTDKYTLPAKKVHPKVRAHVMHDFIRKEKHTKKLRRHPNTAHEYLPIIKGQILQTESSGFEESSQSHRSQTPCGVTWEDSIPFIGSTDPFDTLPLPMPKLVEESFNFHLKYQAPRLIPLEANELSNPISTLLVPLAVSDAAVFHSLLCVAGQEYTNLQAFPKHGAHTSELRKTASPCWHLIYKRHALIAIQKRLNDPVHATSDGTIAAVLLLALHAFMSRADDRLAEYGNHMDGVSKLINIRGGLQMLGLKGFLQQIACWIDLWGSASTSHPLRFHLVSKFRLSRNPSFQEQGNLLAGQGFETLTEANSFQLSVKEALKNLSRTATTYSYCKRHSVAQEDLILLLEERTSLEQRLMSLRRPSKVEEYPLSSDVLHDVCRLAGLIFINAYLRVTDTTTVRTVELMNELCFRLPGDLVMFNSGRERTLLLWIIFVGGSTAFGKPHRQWFVVKLVEFRRSLGLQSWEDTIMILSSYSWSEAHCKASFQQFWTEAATSEHHYVVL